MYKVAETTEWCKSNTDTEERNECDTDKECLDIARSKCDEEPACFGVAWSPDYPNVKVCNSDEMESKTDGWRTMMKSERNQITFSTILSCRL